MLAAPQLPQYDYLYIDMNCIIHASAMADNEGGLIEAKEDEIIGRVTSTVESLFRLINPTELLFLSIDGVVPCAKWNKQRQRRFRVAKEYAECATENLNNNQRDTKHFDTNSISPGTAFMESLRRTLKKFIETKIAVDESWQKCEIILTGSDVPGEGSHKIVQYIRLLKATQTFDELKRHCVFTIDSDLVMLVLGTHLLNVSLLRDEPNGRRFVTSYVDDVEHRFRVMHLEVLRNYLALEFKAVEDVMSFSFDIDRIADDWILLCFLFGNDFMPNLPNLHISANAMPILFKAYGKVLIRGDGYLHENGELNLKRFELFMAAMKGVDMLMFRNAGTALRNSQLSLDSNANIENQMSSLTLVSFFCADLVEFSNTILSSRRKPLRNLTNLKAIIIRRSSSVRRSPGKH